MPEGSLPEGFLSVWAMRIAVEFVDATVVVTRIALMLSSLFRGMLGSSLCFDSARGPRAIVNEMRAKNFGGSSSPFGDNIDIVSKGTCLV